MNRKQEIIKKLAKRAKARQNKVVPSNPSNKTVERYISKAEREKIAVAEAIEQAAATQASSTETDKD
jgi:hypothetical protein